MKSIYRVLLGLAATTGTSSCTTTTISCHDASIALEFVGFTSAELDTLVVQQFAAGSGFSMPQRIDTVTSANVFYQRQGDTLIPSYDAVLQLAAGRDYAVLVPSTGTRATISGIVQEGQQSHTIRYSRLSRVEPAQCINAAVAFMQNGQRVDVPEPELRGATAVVVRQ